MTPSEFLKECTIEVLEKRLEMQADNFKIVMDHRDSLLVELEKCYAEIADKEAIIADFMKAVLKNGCSDTDKIVYEYEQKLI
jgi:hypothetical protein